jgi:hypothetical protein
MEKTAVVVQMTNRYGNDFVKSFLWYTEHPIKPGYQVGGSPEHTPAWFQARGYRLMQTTAGVVRGQVMEYWVHPSGYEIWEIRNQKGAPQTVPVVEHDDDCVALSDATLSILRDTISTETSVKEDLEGEKGRLERMDKTTDDYREQYDRYIQSLQDMKGRVETAVDDIGTMRKQLLEMKCSVSPIDDRLSELEALQFWVDMESNPESTRVLQPIKIRGPKDIP